MNIETYDEVPQYKKKSQKKAPAKSKHKHDYSEEILIHTVSKIRGTGWYSLGKRCTVCGKYKITKGFLTKSVGPASLAMLRDNEVLEKYKGLSVVERAY